MRVIHPNNHAAAIKFWKKYLHSKPNGARTLGKAQAKYLEDIFSPYYDLMVTYASDYEFPIPDGTKKIAVMWHQNFPWTEGFKVWQRVNNKLLKYEVDYFCNEQKIVDLIREVGGSAYFLPRFIDTKMYPKLNAKRDIDTLWFGNKWNEFANEFSLYCLTVDKPYWITHGQFGCGDEVIHDNINRVETLKTLARAKTVWAIGISQLEAAYYGAKVVSYRGEVLPFYDEESIREYARKMLEEINK